MAPKTRTSMTQRSQHFSALLSSAILEWVLMLLLLLEGLLSYLVTAFARLCKLQPPCPMCTRLDHVFGETRPGYYRSLMCNSHKAEASSWAFCHIHQNLVDVHSMCEACVLSFATDNKSNLETYRSLAGKLGAGIGGTGCGHGFSFSSASEAKLMEEDALCSCCSRPLGVRYSCPFVVLQRKDSGVGEICGDVLADRHTDDDEINHVMYSKLKTSDSESEPQQGNVRCSMEEDRAVAADNLKEDFTSSHAQTKIKDGNAEDEVARHSELTQVQNGVSDRKHSEDSRELSNLKPNIQSNDLPRKDDAEQIIEEPHTGDKPEDDVWHNALGSTEELPGTDDDNSAETKAASVEPIPEFSDRTTRQDSFRVHQQDLKLLLTQISTSSRAPDSSTGFADSPTMHESQHEQEAILRNISRALSLERSSSGVSDAGGGVFFNGAAEAYCGGDAVDRLKRQVELDRKSMALLWAELEEERGAAAVAASQAMAMITRLQEEKAAARTEAAQCRRAMEERSAYDDREREGAAAVRGLEAEVEACWAMLRELAAIDEIRDQMRLPRRRFRREGAREPGGSGSAGGGDGFAGFGDESACISEQLRGITSELFRLSNDSRFVGAPGFAAEEEEEGDDGEEEEEAETWAPGRRVRNGNSFTKWQRLQSTGNNGSMQVEVGMAELQKEISELGWRLRALEADRSSFHTT